MSPITWICAALVGAVRYYSGAWEKKEFKISEGRSDEDEQKEKKG